MNDAGGWDWNLVRSFLAVLDAGSLSAAARKSGISQPTLTRHVSELEAALGVTLFQRGRAGAAPTEAALAIAGEARAMADGAGRLGMAAAGRAASVSGTVRITASQIMATYFLAPVIADIQRELPGLAIELVSSNEVDNLLRRDADIAVRMVEPAQLDLVSRHVGELEMGAYVERHYAGRAGVPATLDDLDSHVVVGYDRSENVVRGLAALGKNVGRDFFRYRCDDQVAAFEALRAGVGVGFAPVWLAARYPELLRFGEHFAILPLSVWLVTHCELRTSARIRAVYQRLDRALREIVSEAPHMGKTEGKSAAAGPMS